MKKQTICYLLLAAGLVYFTAAALFRLDLLGMNADESANALSAMQIFDALMREGPAAALLKTPCLMNVFYVGALKYYLSWPWLALGGYTLWASRLSFLPYALVLVVLVFAVLRRWFGLRVAAVAGFLLCVNSAFIRASRTAFRREELVVAMLFWAGLWLIESFRARPRFTRIALAGFVWGLALWSKLMFAAYLIGLGAAAPVLGRDLRGQIKKTVLDTKAFWLGFVPMFAAGVFPLVFYNLIHNGRTLRLCWKSLTVAGAVFPGNDNAQVLASLMGRLGDFWLFLLRDIPEVDSVRVFVPSYFNAGLFLFSLAGLLFWIFFRREQARPWRGQVFVLCAFYASVFVLTVFTPRGAAQGHILIMVPFCEIVVALFVCRVCLPAIGTRRGRTAALALFLLMQTTTEFAALLPVYSDRGRGYFSQLPAELADFFGKARAGAVVAPYFLKDSLIFLSRSRVRARGDGMPPDRHSAGLDYNESHYAAIRDMDMYYLVTAEGPGCPDYSAGLLGCIGRDGKRVFTLKTIPARDEGDFNCTLSFVSRNWEAADGD